MTPPQTRPPRWLSPRWAPAPLSAVSAQLTLPGVATPVPLTLGEFAHEVIGERFERMVSRERAVIEANDPEALHQMRVGTRRLRTVMTLFAPVIRLPRSAEERRVRALTRILGRLRDLEVQASELRGRYRSAVASEARGAVDDLIARRERKREKAAEALQRELHSPRYRRLKSDFEEWLERPRFTLLASLPLRAALPDLLSTSLADLLLHPGWLLKEHPLRPADSATRHELRKTVKRIRYQAECLAGCYGGEFAIWLEELHTLQNKLGVLQDGDVLLETVADVSSKRRGRSELASAIRNRQAEAMEGWEAIRTRYLSQEERQRLRLMLLEPVGEGRR